MLAADMRSIWTALLFTAALGSALEAQAAPGAHRAAIGRAADALGKNAYAAALRELEAIPPAEANASVLALRAGAHLGLGRPKEAAALYQAALKSAPEGARPPLMFGLAESWRAMGSKADAKRLLRQLLERSDLDPGLRAAARARL